jgi:hypothetical protein
MREMLPVRALHCLWQIRASSDLPKRLFALGRLLLTGEFLHLGRPSTLHSDV